MYRGGKKEEEEEEKVPLLASKVLTKMLVHKLCLDVLLNEARQLHNTK